MFYSVLTHVTFLLTNFITFFYTTFISVSCCDGSLLSCAQRTPTLNSSEFTIKERPLTRCLFYAMHDTSRLLSYLPETVVWNYREDCTRHGRIVGPMRRSADRAWTLVPSFSKMHTRPRRWRVLSHTVSYSFLFASSFFSYFPPCILSTNCLIINKNLYNFIYKLLLFLTFTNLSLSFRTQSYSWNNHRCSLFVILSRKLKINVNYARLMFYHYAKCVLYAYMINTLRNKEKIFGFYFYI